jgi:D-arabinose 1-dehydrogenase-like Zn-dependent alcohol dehydrogenase
MTGNAYPLHQAAAAMRRLKAGRVRRKLVITMTPAG